MATRIDDDTTAVEIELRARWAAQVNRLPRAERRAGMADMCTALQISQSTAYDICKAYAKGGKDALRRKEPGTRGIFKALTPDEVKAWIAWCKDPRRCAWDMQKLCETYREELQRAHGVTVSCSDATLKRALKKADPSFMKTRKERTRELQRRGQMESPYSNFLWEADQRQGDFFVREEYVDLETGEIKEREYRPLLFHFVDHRSGAIMGGFWFKGNHQAYSVEVVEAALMDAIFPSPHTGLPFCGVPEVIYWDKGAPHHCRFMTRLAEVLGIELTETLLPENPQPHGFIEGHHRILKDKFEVELPGFCGGDNKQEKRPLQMRMADDGEIEPDRLLTLEELNQRWLDWQAKFHNRGYRGGASRLDRWVRDVTAERRKIPDPQRLALDAMHDQEVTVRGGQFQLQGIKYTGERLGSLPTEKVHVRFLRGDIWRVIVLLEGRVFCIAHPVEGRLWKGLNGYAECAQYRRELKGSLANVDESLGLLRAAGETGVVDAAEVEQAVDTLGKLREAKGRDKLAVADRAKRTAEPPVVGKAEVIHLHPPGLAELHGEREKTERARAQSADTIDKLLDADQITGGRQPKAAIDEWMR